MDQFDPALRRETWLFQNIGNQNNQPVYRCLKYMLVSYDNDPVQVIEPWPMEDFLQIQNNSLNVVTPRSDGLGRVVGFQFFDRRPFEVLSLDDFDAANNAI